MAKKTVVEVSTRSAATAKSWLNKKTATARRTHHAVKVGGVEYPSTYQAFVALNLDTKKHIALSERTEGGRQSEIRRPHFRSRQ
jgi:phage anti-repressor protein